ncbi:ketopantoate reductase family protein [Dactylosporangium sp. NPDC000555]|uniref:ketopantoate reductase family protein n=1 Tax=Dactylosporangium sp. NPDC000555 TaxID=3154260 RepID=UPI00332E3FEE
MMARSTVWVVGAGAIGAVAAARLADRHEVVVVDPWAAHVDAVNAAGLRLTEPLGDHLTRPRAVLAQDAAGADVPDPDLVLLAVKSTHTRSALAEVRSRLGPRTPVVSLQNGLNEDAIAECVGADRTVGAVVRYEAALTGPGAVTQYKTDGWLSIGEIGGPATDRTRAVAAILADGIRTEVTDDISTELWTKLIRNCMLNPVAAVSGLGLRSMAEQPHAARCWAGIAREAAGAAARSGVHLPAEVFYGVPAARLVGDGRVGFDAVVAALTGAYLRSPDVRPSMLQDIDKGRRTEVDFLNGEVARRCDRLGIDAAVNLAITERVHDVEDGAEQGVALLPEVVG